jgi:hypothetical protein
MKTKLTPKEIKAIKEKKAKQLNEGVKINK